MYARISGWYPEKPISGASSFRSSITSSGRRMLMVVMGRSLRSRFWIRSFMLIDPPLRGCGQAGGDDAKSVCFMDDVHDEEKTPVFCQPDHRVSLFASAAGIHEAE